MEEVTLPKLLRDWLDKSKFPIVSITGVNQTYGATEALGHIWIGDFDVAVIYSNKVGFVGRTTADGPTRLTMWLHAEDPQFFHKLEETFTSLLDALKNN